MNQVLDFGLGRCLLLSQVVTVSWGAGKGKVNKGYMKMKHTLKHHLLFLCTYMQSHNTNRKGRAWIVKLWCIFNHLGLVVLRTNDCHPLVSYIQIPIYFKRNFILLFKHWKISLLLLLLIGLGGRWEEEYK